MTDHILYSFLGLFALFGKEEQVDKAWAKSMLINYLRRHFGIKNIDVYLDLYTDMRDLYELSFDTDIKDTINDICSNLNGQISSKEEALLLLRLMEFCSDDGKISDCMFRIMAENFGIPDDSIKTLPILSSTIRRPRDTTQNRRYRRLAENAVRPCNGFANLHLYR